ncbi:MAG: DUF4097 domain-containing protein [Gemmatimonadales bacterium]
MIHTLLFLAAIGGVGDQRGTDTTIAVRQGSRLRLQQQGGDITIRAWDQDRMRIQAEHSSRTEIEVDNRGSVIQLRGRRGSLGLGGVVDYELTVPTWMAVELGGLESDIVVEGTRAPIKVSTIDGEIRIRGGTDVTVSTAQGRIDVTGARGRVELHSASDDIRVEDVQGEITVEAVSGSIMLRRIAAASVDAQTVSGDVTFEGTIAEAGTYSFLSHSGDVVVALPDNSNATISVSSANGDVESSLDLKTDRRSRRRATYTMGNGSASIEVETFSGDVRLIRPSELRPERRPERERGRDRDRDRERGERGRDFDFDLDLSLALGFGIDFDFSFAFPINLEIRR